MGEYEPPDEWVSERIDKLKQDAHIEYYNNTLDTVHDDTGVYDDTGDLSDDLYNQPPTLGQRVRNWLYWQWRWLVLSVALLIPALLLVGVLLLAGSLDGDAKDTDGVPAANVTEPATAMVPVVGDWPAINYAPHTVPAMIRHEIGGIGVVHGYQFEGAAGDVWQITVEPGYGSALDPQLQLYGPSGEQLATNDNRTTGDPSAELVVTLPADGAYRVVILAAGEGLTVGEYWLMVYEQ